MIRFPTSIPDALAAAIELDGDYRAAGSDLQERRRHLPILAERRPLIELRDVPGLVGITTDASGAQVGARIGASTTLAAIAEHPALRGLWPGVAEACGVLATPQIRAIGTLAGNLMQGPRCWYYRHPDYTCLRKGGDTCYSRKGDHSWHVCFDYAPCAAPHPSTAAMALLAYAAEVELATADSPEPVRRSLAEVVEPDGLEAHELITAVLLGPPLPREQTAYVRIRHREHAEWALIEAMARLVLADDGTLASVVVVAGAIASTPLRLTKVEAELLGHKPEPARLAAAAVRSGEGASPLTMTEYKLPLLEVCVLEALEQALARPMTPAAITPATTPSGGT